MSTFSLSLNHHIDLPDDLFRLMRDEIYKRTGMWFADSSKYLLQKRLSPRARELNFDSFQKYFYFLQYDPRADAEFDHGPAVCDRLVDVEADVLGDAPAPRVVEAGDRVVRALAVGHPNHSRHRHVTRSPIA